MPINTSSRKVRYVIYLNEHGELSDIKKIWRTNSALFGMETAPVHEVMNVLRLQPTRNRRWKAHSQGGCYP